MDTEQSRPGRVVVCAIAALLGLLILVEPMLMDVRPGLQIFQGVFLVWFWALFMFGGGPDSPTRQK